MKNSSSKNFLEGSNPHFETISEILKIVFFFKNRFTIKYKELREKQCLMLLLVVGHLLVLRGLVAAPDRSTARHDVLFFLK